MSAIKISKRTVDALEPGAKPYIAFDADLKGFGVRVMPSGGRAFVVEYRPNGGGRANHVRRVTLGRMGALTPEQARRAAQDLLARVRLGADPAAEKLAKRAAATLADVIEAYIAEHVETKLKLGSRREYRRHLQFLRGRLGSQKADAIRRAQLAALHVEKRASPYQANRFLATVSSLYSWAETRGFTPEGFNPAAKIEHYREQARDRFLTTEELARLGDALRQAETEGLPTAKGARVRLDPFAVGAIRLLLLTGARVQEILTARWDMVDLERGMIFLEDSKTGRKPLILSAPAMAVLGSLPRTGRFIFPGRKPDKPRTELNRAWRRVCDAAGIDGVRRHDLRHTFASYGVGNAMGLPIVGKLLGHTQAATTARYAHLETDPLHRAANAIGGVISTAMGEKP